MYTLIKSNLQKIFVQYLDFDVEWLQGRRGWKFRIQVKVFLLDPDPVFGKLWSEPAPLY